MIKTLIKHHDPEVLVITPLLTGHKISNETRKSIRKNKLPFVWISYMGAGNPCKNTQKAFNSYRDNNKLPPYVIKIDNDIVASKGMIDNMYLTLKNASSFNAYCYCSFEFQGYINARFPAVPFDPDRLRVNNYISSCSLIDTKRLIEVGMWVTNDEGFRLLDWALWLKFLKRGYVGIPDMKSSFVATATASSVSSRDANDYNEKRKWVLKNFS